MTVDKYPEALARSYSRASQLEEQERQAVRDCLRFAMIASECL